MSTAPKQWTVTAVSPAVGPVAVLRDGLPLPQEIGPGRTTPVELLLASIGTCFALSCHIVFTTRAIERVGLNVTVTGRKGSQPANRLADIKIEVSFDASLPPAQAHAVAAAAEQLCTVTNTITAEPPCAVSVDVLGATSLSPD